MILYRFKRLQNFFSCGMSAGYADQQTRKVLILAKRKGYHNSMKNILLNVGAKTPIIISEKFGDHKK